MLGSLSVGLALLRTVNPAESDAFRVLVVEDFDGVAVEEREKESTEAVKLAAIAKRRCIVSSRDGKRFSS